MPTAPRVGGTAGDGESQTRRDGFRISLRVTHPSLEPSDISEGLRLAPGTEWAAGAPRVTPTGEPLAGTRNSTYWSAPMEDGADGGELTSAIERATDALLPRREFVRYLRETGGRAEYFIGWFIGTSAGLELPSALLEKIASLGIDLAFDVYGQRTGGVGARHEVVRPPAES